MSAEVLLAAGYAVAARRRRVRARVALGAHAPPLAALPHRRLHLRRRARRLGVPGGRAPVAARVRPRAPARPLPRQGAHLQRLPAKHALHRLRRWPRDRASARPVAALGGRAVPPGHRAPAGRPGRSDRARRRWPATTRQPTLPPWSVCSLCAGSRPGSCSGTCGPTPPDSQARGTTQSLARRHIPISVYNAGDGTSGDDGGCVQRGGRAPAAADPRRAGARRAAGQRPGAGTRPAPAPGVQAPAGAPRGGGG